MGLYISGNCKKNRIKLAKLFAQSPLFSLYTQPAANVTFFLIFMFNVFVFVVVFFLYRGSILFRGNGRMKV